MRVKLTLIARIVAACCRHAWAVSVVGLALGVFALVYGAQHFAMNTDSSKLIAPDLPWRQAEATFDATFLQQSCLTCRNEVVQRL